MNLATYAPSNNRIFNGAGNLEQVLGLAPAIHSWSQTHEDQDNYYLQLDVPGVRKEDVTIQIESDELKISAVRHLLAQNEKSLTLNRKFIVPEDVDREKIRAEQKDGVLTITLPKKEESKPKTISINVQ